MTKITRERLLKIQQWRETYGTGSNVMLPAEEAEELARIALVSLTAEPVAWRLLDSPESSVTVTDNEKMAAIWKRNGRNVQPLYSTAHGSADAVGMVVSEGRQPSAHNPDSRIFEVLVESGYEPVPGDKLYAAPTASERERIRHEHAEWSQATFGNVGPIGPLKHLSKEALEAAANPEDPLEWADMQFLLWDAQRRMGLSDEFITRAMIEKLAINKARQWPEPKDGEPRLHIKEQPAPVVPDGLRQALSNAGIAAPESDEMLAATCEKYIQMLVTWVKDRKPFQPAPVSVPDGLKQAVEFYEQVKQENTPVETGAWKDAVNWVLDEARRAALLQSKYRDLSQPVDPQISEYEQIMLQAGWVMVPIEPTDEMIAAAMECDDVVFDSKDPTAFCVQYREIYCAMVDVAPQPEGNNG
ncbi:DUF550 domain-containing protein [Salmonella enterica subsp. diarizonae serovar 16:z10:e,n,x,z15]|uniref:DUF550 domain-containing protein n=1 Tax=Salmonella enterica TaxID=28901 RepID=UPI001F0DB80B|nr:DUF550 domain-containing protein [Salmonella enterica subsp. diarizonae serovar 16:z10:e,n,x,z15]MCH5506915.1 DUF550 domain-containing protein [Salmonella enterica subsp. diarizonae serovar 16:z10:e,n,x,z15]